MAQVKAETCLICGHPMRMGPHRVIFCPVCNPGVSKLVMWCSDCDTVVSVVNYRGEGGAYCLSSRPGHPVDMQTLELRPL